MAAGSLPPGRMNVVQAFWQLWSQVINSLAAHAIEVTTIAKEHEGKKHLSYVAKDALEN